MNKLVKIYVVQITKNSWRIKSIIGMGFLISSFNKNYEKGDLKND